MKGNSELDKRGSDKRGDRKARVTGINRQQQAGWEHQAGGCHERERGDTLGRVQPGVGRSG